MEELKAIRRSQAQEHFVGILTEMQRDDQRFATINHNGGSSDGVKSVWGERGSGQ